MSLISIKFVLFILVSLVVYYTVSDRFKWKILLFESLLFYCWGGGYKTLIYIIATAFSTWLAALIIDTISKWNNEYLRLNIELDTQKRKNVKARATKIKKITLLITLIFNLLILGFVKYTNFAIDTIIHTLNILPQISLECPKIGFLIPLGISYYTFQSLGYLIDVYRGNYEAEKNFGKYILFVTYFPQIVQGPIGRFNHLGNQLTTPKPLDPNNLKHGAILMLWGYVKKMVIADSLAPLVITVSKNWQKYDGSLIVLSVFLYAIQLYTDFSGGIDIVSGVSELFGIYLAPNFKRPYFATSLGDFWRRWHVSLGDWMRDYVFYPFAMSKGVTKLSKKLKSKSKFLAKAFPAMIGNIVVFLIVGIWHGAEWRFIVWGLYNGLLLAISVALAPIYEKSKEKFPFLNKSKIWYCVQVIRTFIIVCIGNYFDCCQRVQGAFLMMKKSIFDFHLSAISLDVVHSLGIETKAYIALLIALPLLAGVSIAQERGVGVRQWLDRQNIAVQWLLLYGLIFFFIGFAVTGTNAMEGFMYEIF